MTEEQLIEQRKQRLERIKKETKLHVKPMNSGYMFNNQVILSCGDYQFLIDLAEKSDKNKLDLAIKTLTEIVEQSTYMRTGEKGNYRDALTQVRFDADMTLKEMRGETT